MLETFEGRLKRYLAKLIEEMQCDFREEIGTQDQLFIIK